MEKELTYAPKEELDEIAKEVIEFLRPKKLPIWKINKVLTIAKDLIEWEKMK